MKKTHFYGVPMKLCDSIFLERHFVCPKVISFCHLSYAFNINGDHSKICLMVVGLTIVIYQMILKPVDRKIILPRVINLPHFSLHVIEYG